MFRCLSFLLPFVENWGSWGGFIFGGNVKITLLYWLPKPGYVRMLLMKLLIGTLFRLLTGTKLLELHNWDIYLFKDNAIPILF